MVDFEELSRKLTRQAPINPRDIFQQLPRPVGVGDLYASQAEVLDSWFARRTRRDIVVKQPTGGGKTLIGLLVGQSILNEKHGPVLYLVPTRQLVTQIAAEAAKFTIPIVSYLGGTGGGLPNEFLSSQAICVATYHALFNGRSVFGLTGATLTPIQVAGIILDDAHAAFDIMRESFTLVVPNDAPNSLYLELCTRFKSHFEEISRAGTFEDIIGRKDNGVLEIPYWAWYEKLNEVRGLLRPQVDQLARFVWPLLRDNLEFCHAMISKDAFSITPMLLPLELFPTYANCPSRVYMSATIADDSELIRTFAADPESVQAPAQSKSLAGVGQRMILVPELMRLPKDVAPQKLTRALLSKAKVQKINALVLVSSRLGFEAWKDLSIPANTSEEVEQIVAALQRGEKLGPVIFANRYDGIDLPGDACRVLVLSGVPSGTSDYDKYRGAVLTGAAINTTLAQRIEQGIGRGARGAGDYCVVILDGHSLVAWLGRENNTNYLTAATKQQIQIGKMVSSAVNSEKDFLDTVDKCLLQDASWKGFYAMRMAEAAVLGTPEELPIKIATAERKSFDLWRQARHHLARAALDSVIGEVPDKSQQGWLLQQTARIVHSENNVPEAQKIQVRAHALNRQLSRSRIAPTYSLLPEPSEQSKEVWRRLRDYGNAYGYIAYFNERVTAFTTISSSNQFEEAIKELGNFLGFGSERPEAETGKGPDVLWRTATSEDFVIEAKSDKDPKNPLKKSEHGQLLVSVAWYKANYKDKKCIGLVVHPNALATDNAGATDALALTLDTLNSLVSDLRKVLQELADSGKIGGTAEQLCAELLNRHGLDPDSIKKRLQLFKVAKS